MTRGGRSSSRWEVDYKKTTKKGDDEGTRSTGYCASVLDVLLLHHYDRGDGSPIVVAENVSRAKKCSFLKGKIVVAPLPSAWTSRFPTMATEI
jgi:hypothetical protein